MQNLISIMAVLSLGNTLLTQLVKWLLAKLGVNVTGTGAVVLSWVAPVAATAVMWSMGLLGGASWFGALVFAALSALSSNRVYDIFKSQN